MVEIPALIKNVVVFEIGPASIDTDDATRSTYRKMCLASWKAKALSWCTTWREKLASPPRSRGLGIFAGAAFSGCEDSERDRWGGCEPLTAKRFRCKKKKSIHGSNDFVHKAH